MNLQVFINELFKKASVKQDIIGIYSNYDFNIGFKNQIISSL